MTRVRSEYWPKIVNFSKNFIPNFKTTLSVDSDETFKEATRIHVSVVSGSTIEHRKAYYENNFSGTYTLHSSNNNRGVYKVSCKSTIFGIEQSFWP